MGRTGNHRWRIGAATLVLALAAAGCGVDAGTLRQAAPPTGEGSTTGTAPDSPGLDAPTTAPPGTEQPVTDITLEDVAEDLQDFWARQFPNLFGQEYERVPADRIIAATPGTDIPACDGRSPTYEEVQGNAFAAGCPEGPLVVWDAEGLVPELDDQYGPVGAAIVLAHEWGHIAQFQAGLQGPTVLFEQQADCYAGSWLADVIDDAQGLDQIANQTALDRAISVIIGFRDALGSSPDDPSAHGTGFDRVRALQDGIDRGAEYCAGYDTASLPLIDLPFLSAEDVASGGNLPLADLIPLVVDDLNTFYTAQVSSFGGGFTTEEVLADDETMATMQDLSDRIGDVAAGVVLGLVWAQQAQKDTGAYEDRDEAGRLLQQACLSGGWLASIYLDADNPDRGIYLSPGDLDEAILGLVDIGGGNSGQDTEGAVFQLVAALRQGVVEGFESCDLPT